jgi:hypothetical protein
MCQDFGSCLKCEFYLASRANPMGFGSQGLQLNDNSIIAGERKQSDPKLGMI